jgi:phospholipase/carboxylesterase
MNGDPHGSGPVRQFGMPLANASGAVILLHGRGASAEDILALASELYLPGLTYLAPQAAGNSWYPNSFLAPIALNEPWLSSALRKVETALEMTIDDGVSADRIVIGGFSQGACLASEFIAGHPRRYAGLIAFSGGLIGPPGADLAHQGDLAGTPALLSGGDPDPHVPWQRMEQSSRILAGMGAEVILRRYENRPHTISSDEIDLARTLLQNVYGTNVGRSDDRIALK